MGINVKVQNDPKPDDIIFKRVSFEKDLRSCMRCKFFCGNNSQCITKNCVEKDSKSKTIRQDKENNCFECPYQQSEQYCFPCMKKLLGKGEMETNKNVLEQEEKADG